jgi:hypothetical protein
MRTTVHLIATEDAEWQLPIFNRRNGNWLRTRLLKLGVSDEVRDRALGLMEAYLAEHGPTPRPELLAHLVESGIEVTPETRYHYPLLMQTEGIACCGPDRGARVCFALQRDWIGKPKPFDLESSLCELARRYLRAFGPASERDFARWSGLPIGEVRLGLAGIAGEIAEQRAGEEVLLSLKGAKPRLPKAGQVRLLGPFDTYVLGYESRDFAVAGGEGGRINTDRGGMIEPVIVRDGEVLGAWDLARKGGSIRATLLPYAPLDSEVVAAVDRELADIARFEGGEASLVKRG